VFERYTEPARRAIFFARYEGSRFGSDYIEPEHLLLGILRADPNIATKLRSSGVTEESIRARIGPGRERVSTSVDMPLNSHAKRALRLAAEETKTAIRPEHLLLGLAREESSVAANILFEAGLTVSVLRELATNSAPSDPGRRDVEQVMRTLASAVPPGNEWVAPLAAYIARSSGEDIEALIAAIRRC
jgi:ATP-dependent Clp protease ATP-binding subunit ClpC